MSLNRLVKVIGHIVYGYMQRIIETLSYA